MNDFNSINFEFLFGQMGFGHFFVAPFFLNTNVLLIWYKRTYDMIKISGELNNW